MGEDWCGIDHDLPACVSFAVGLGDHMEVGVLGTSMGYPELGGRVQNASLDSLTSRPPATVGSREETWAQRVLREGCRLETLLMAGGLCGTWK